MSEVKFTKGPWKTVQRTTSNIQIHTNTGKSERRICTIDSPVAVDLANAALIAATPDMYNLIEWIYETLNECGECHIQAGTPVDTLISEIRAKSRGEK